MNLNELPARELAARIARREVSCEAVARDCLDRIMAREPAIGAWAHLDADAAIARARVLDRQPVSGCLHGVGVGVKDVMDTADMPAGYGSSIYARHQPAADAACVAMAKRAGALILGKTVTTEFATSTPRGTRNPHAPDHTPGGSSSGSAAAVADCMVPLAFGTQTGGSTLRPASYCGIVGYKPGFGVINRTGVKPVSDALDTVGLFARDVPDVALFAAAATGCMELADLETVSRPRCGIWRGPEWRHALPESVSALEMAVGALQRAGAQVGDARVPAQFASIAQVHQDIEYFEMARGFAWERDHHREALSAAFIDRLQGGDACSLERYQAAHAHAQTCRDLLDALMAEYDVLVSPSAPGEAPRGLASTGSAVFNSTWTLMHVPAISLPGFAGPHGLPVGVQLIGRRRSERWLLSIAAFAAESFARFGR